MIKIVMYFFALGIPLEGPIDVYEGKGVCTPEVTKELILETLEEDIKFAETFNNRIGELVITTRPLDTTKVGSAFICEELL